MSEIKHAYGQSWDMCPCGQRHKRVGSKTCLSCARKADWVKKRSASSGSAPNAETTLKQVTK